MRFLKLALLLVVAATLYPGNGYGDERTDQRVRLALALSAAKQQPIKAVSSGVCTCGTNCTCINGECGDPNCPSLRRSTYENKYLQAVRENKPILVWVSNSCLPCEKAWSDWVHVRVASYTGRQGKITGPCVIVGKPDGRGEIDLLGTLDGCPSRATVESILNPPPQIYQQPVFQPMFMMGGFGGGGC